MKSRWRPTGVEVLDKVVFVVSFSPQKSTPAKNDEPLVFRRDQKNRLIGIGCQFFWRWRL